jgi:protein-tyrosine phosphatase
LAGDSIRVTRSYGPSARIRGKESRLGRERILFICTANVDRSRTAEDLYRDDPRYEVLSAGLAPFAANPMSRELMQWADRVFVMCERDERHRTLLKLRFPDVDRPVVDLEIEDRWYRGDPELVRRILKRLAPHLGPPRKPGDPEE